MYGDDELLKFLGEDKLKVSYLMTDEEKGIFKCLFDSMSKEFGIASTLSDSDGSPVMPYSNFTSICEQHIRTCPIGLARCKEEAARRGKKAEKKRRPEVYVCHAGFFDFIAPIMLLGRRIGNVAGGQALAKPADDDMQATFSTYMDEIGVADKKQAMAALSVSYVHSREKIERLVTIFDYLGQMLSNYFRNRVEQQYWKQSLMKLNEQLEQRIEERTHELQQANSELSEALRTLHEAESQLIRRERLAALGDLVAGVAHEINTPVGIGVTAGSYLEQKIGEMEVLYQSGGMKRADFERFISTCKQASGAIMSNLNRAADIIKSFKRVAVDQSSEVRCHFNLLECFTAVLTSLHPKLKHMKHQIDIRCDEDLEVDNFPGAFSQIITNLLMNTLIHAYIPEQVCHITIEAYASGERLMFSYADDGKGISDENLEHLFEPFFTTRRAQGGTGLGLHIIYNIVTQKLGGIIHCESAVGQGAKFIMNIPLVWGGDG